MGRIVHQLGRAVLMTFRWRLVLVVITLVRVLARRK